MHEPLDEPLAEGLIEPLTEGCSVCACARRTYTFTSNNTLTSSWLRWLPSPTVANARGAIGPDS